MVFPYKYFKLTFGESGDTTVVPDDNPGDGSVSFETGFGADYSKDPEDAMDPGRRIDRGNFNYLDNVFTQTLKQYQEFGVPAFIDATTNGGVDFPYAQGARCYFPTDGSPVKTYESLEDNNTALPTDPTKWKEVPGSPAIVSIEGTATASLGPGTISYNDEYFDSGFYQSNRCCAFDPDGNMWICSSDSIAADAFIYKATISNDIYEFDGTEVNLSTETGQANVFPSALHTDPDGNLWFNVGVTMYRMDFAGGTYSYGGINFALKGGSGTPVAMGNDPDGNLWILTDSEELDKYDFAVGTYTFSGIPFTVDVSPEVTTASGGCVDSYGNMWAFDGANTEFEKYAWSSAGGGTMAYAGASFQFDTSLIAGFGGGMVDQEGNMWLSDGATLNGSLLGTTYKFLSQATTVNIRDIGKMLDINAQVTLPDASVVRCTGVVDDDNATFGVVIPSGAIAGTTTARVIREEDYLHAIDNDSLVLRRPETDKSLATLTRNGIFFNATNSILSYASGLWKNQPKGKYEILVSQGWSRSDDGSDYIFLMSANGNDFGISGSTGIETLRQEPKDDAGDDGDGRDTDQKFILNRKWIYQHQTDGDILIQLSHGGSTNGPVAAAWQVNVTLRRLNDGQL